MYRCSDSIGCLRLSAYRIGEGLKVKAEKALTSEPIEVRAWRIGEGLSVTAYSLADKKEPLLVVANKVGEGLKVTANIVCTIGNVTIDYVPFLVKEGEFVLVDGRIFNVKSYGL